MQISQENWELRKLKGKLTGWWYHGTYKYTQRQEIRRQTSTARLMCLQLDHNVRLRPDWSDKSQNKTVLDFENFLHRKNSLRLELDPPQYSFLCSYSQMTL